jgi:GT2 family glycosyltransferase
VSSNARAARPSVSLVVCTRDRADALAEMLGSIALGHPGPEDELVVVDNGSTDGTAGVIEEFATDSPLRVVRVFEAEAGLARARNRGLAAASRDILAFTDDDCRLAPGYFEAVADALRDGGGLDYCGGRLLRASPEDASYGLLHDTQPSSIPPMAFHKAGRIPGACMAVRREVVDAVGGFDTSFGAGTRWRCEDVDFLQRASLAGFEGAFCPTVAVYHAHGRRADEVSRLRYADDLARGAYYAKFALRGSRAHLNRLIRTLNLRRPRHRGEVKGAATYLAHRGRMRTARFLRRGRRPVGSTGG